MRTPWLLLTVAAHVSLAMLTSLAHPGSGIVVDKQGNVYFTHTGRGAAKIDPQGNLSYLYQNTGGHWLALDTEGSFSSSTGNRLFERITPTGAKPALLFASGGAPLVVSSDGNLYYGSGFPGGDDLLPGGFTVTRMSLDGTKTLFSPELKTTLEKLGQAVTGLTRSKDGTLYVAGPSAILKVKLDGSVTTLIHPIVVQDCTFAPLESVSRFYHGPFVRGLDVTDDGSVYAAVTGCHCVVKITPQGKVDTVLKSESPWAPTGVAAHGANIYVLEYSNTDQSTGWTPRVRKLGADGKVTVLAEVAPTVLAEVAPNVPAPSPPKSFPGSKAGEQREVSGVKLCWCPPGQFLMGSPSDEPNRRPDEAQVQVTLTKGFWMGKYEVTQGEWKRVMGEFPGPRTEIAGEGDEFPLYWLNYSQVEEFCRKLTETARKSGELPVGWEFRIPTEAQWEYACRAGTTTATSFGNSLDRKQANFAGKPYQLPDGPKAGPPLHRATKVGSYPSNAWGLHDMHGNEFEWCRDWYHTNLPGGIDPDLSSVQGARNRDGTYSRARRGGAWVDDGQFCRSAYRLRYEPHRGSDHIGLRVVVVQL